MPDSTPQVRWSKRARKGLAELSRYRIGWARQPKQPKERTPVSTVFMAVTLPVWLPLLFIGLGVYLVGALVVVTARFAWDLTKIIRGSERKHSGVDKAIALVILLGILFFAYKVAVAFAG